VTGGSAPLGARLGAMTRLAVVIGAATLALVAPLALGATTLEQRLALAILVGAAVWLGGRLIAWPAGRPALAIGAAVGAAALLLATAPAALASERLARAAIEARAGGRLMALGLAAPALARFEAADRLAPGRSAAGLADAHLALAEAAVAPGLSSERYRLAGEHLAAALAAEPTNRRAADLAEAVAAVRQADVIWNRYDWPATIGELRKAEARRPDLPGLADKLRDAELSYAASRR
jgi:hypothetical protein